ncbi:hypothetical protein ACLQ18_13315 [Streptomyces sp. DT193]
MPKALKTCPQGAAFVAAAFFVISMTAVSLADCFYVRLFLATVFF